MHGGAQALQAARFVNVAGLLGCLLIKQSDSVISWSDAPQAALEGASAQSSGLSGFVACEIQIVLQRTVNPDMHVYVFQW